MDRPSFINGGKEGNRVFVAYPNDFAETVSLLGGYAFDNVLLDNGPNIVFFIL
jgi:hypothetical protein